MSKQNLAGQKFAILVANGFEESEFIEPKKAIEDNGGEVEVVSLQSDQVKSWSHGNWSNSYDVDRSLENANPSDYNGLVLPGGVMNPDYLRRHHQAIGFIQGFFRDSAQKPVAAICHAPWTLIDADVVQGRTLTSFPTLRRDLENAGAHWVDEEVVVDHGLVTSRSPRDLPSFNAKMVEEFSEGLHKNYSAGRFAESPSDYFRNH